MTQLNHFTGQLYFKDYDAYTDLRMTLGLVGEEAESQKGQWCHGGSDSFVAPENRRGITEINKLSSSPLPFLEQLVGLRRKGRGYKSTYVGRILHAGLLKREDFKKVETFFNRSPFSPSDAQLWSVGYMMQQRKNRVNEGYRR